MASTTYYNNIQQLYVAYFNRPADVPGLQYWEGVVEAANGSTAAVSKAFAASAEYKTATAGLDAYHLVGQIYNNLFGHDADVAGLNFWAQGLIAGNFTVDTAVTAIAAGAQGSDAVAYNDKVSAAISFTSALDTSAKILGYSGPAANIAAKAFLSGVTSDATLAAATAPAALAASVATVTGASNTNGSAFTLTTGMDSGSAFTATGSGNNVFSGTDQTFSASDSLVATRGNNTLTISDTHGGSAAGVPAGVTVSGIQTMSVTASGSIGNLGVSGATAQVTTLTLPAGTAAASQIADYSGWTFTAGDKISIVFGGISQSYTFSGTAATDLANIAALINTVTGTTDATVVAGTSIHFAAPGVGASLPVIALLPGTTFTTSVIPAATATQAAVPAHTVNFTYGGVAGSYTETGVAHTDALNLAAAINGIAGSTVAAAGVANTITLTAPVAGTPLPGLSFTAGAGSTTGDLPAVVITTANSAGTGSGVATTYDVSGFTGLTQFNGVSSGVGDNITAAKTTNVTESAAGSVILTGGLVDNITAGGNVTVSKAAGALNINAGGNVTTTLSGDAVTIATTGNISAGGGTSLNASIIGAISNVTQLADVSAKTTANTAAGKANTADVNAGALVTGLGTLTAGLNAVPASIAANNALTFTAENNGFITQAQKTAIDTAYATAFNAAGGTAALASTAALAVESSIALAAASAKASTAAALIVANLANANAATVVARDTGAAAYNISETVNTALASATVAGNYNGTVTLTDGSTLQSVLTKVSVTNAGTATLTGNAITNVTIADQSHGVQVINNTVGHTQNFALNGVTGASAVTLTDNFASTINIVGTGTVTNKTNIVAAAATALNISGSAGFSDLSTSTLAQANAVVTATGSTGSVTMSLTAGQSFAGGSGASSINVLGNTLQTGTVTAGAGTTDKLTLNDAAQIATSAAAKLFTGFETLVDKATGQIDISTLSNSNFTGVTLTSATANITGLNAAQAANITDSQVGASTITLGVTGASTVGQLDMVHLIASASDGATQTFGTPSIAGVETLNLTANNGVVINSLTGASALTSMNIDGAGSVSVTTGASVLNVNTVIDAHLSTGNITVDASLATTNPLRIIGSLVGANALTAQTGAYNDVLIGGNGGDTILGGGNTGNLTITSGNGNNIVSAFGGGNETITVGNGYNTISTGAGADTIIVGTGGNTVTGGGGLDKITFGAHAFGVIDTAVFGVSAVGAANVTTITGFTTGTDIIQLNAGVGATLTGLTLAAGTSTAATLLGAVADTTSVANLAAVYTQLASDLDNSLGHEFAASTALAGGLVAREVVFTTGAAAGTYLVINNGAAGFAAGSDIVIKLVGTTAVVAGDIHVV